MSLKLNINDEVSSLDTVILGIGEDLGGPGSLNPKVKFHLEHDSYPTQSQIQAELNDFQKILIENGVKVFRPVNFKNRIQIFTRDIGFVIGDEFFVSSMIEERQKEIEGIQYLIDLMNPKKIVYTSKQKGVQIEGGDVLVCNDKIFVGQSERTNLQGYRFLKQHLSGRKVTPVKLVIDKNNHRLHALHLDCVFQPVGDNHAIIYERGIKNLKEFYNVLNLPEANIFKVNKWQFVRMFTNIFSVSKDTVLIEREFIDLKYWLLEQGFKVIEVNYNQVSKLSGLLRCSTLPLTRKK
ncbi:MAG TPA: arginine deiminase family protein [Bacteroidia bacterium]|jgi:N-dimethylarginine dimethylaminohydrolase